MTINEIVKQYNIKLCEYPPNLWDRAGFYYAPLRTVYINSALSEKEKKKVKRKHTITEFLYRSRCIKEKKYIVFPVGYFSDDASILEIVATGGIASSQTPLVKIRISDDQISSEEKYPIEKTKAAIMYNEWYMNNPMLEVSQQEIKNSVDWWAYGFFQSANIINKILILYLVPKFVWPLKQKIILFIKVCISN